MKLYKYMPMALMEDFLTDPCIRITPSSCQNDPFEFGYSADDLKKFDADKLKSYSESHGIISLSSTPKNIIMWSHYADKNKGFVATIDVDIDAPNESFSNCLLTSQHPEQADFLFDKVNYETQRHYPKYKPSQDENQIKKHYYFTKNIAWRAEEEYRFIVPFNCVNRILLKKSFLSDNPNIYSDFEGSIFSLNADYWEVKEEHVLIMVMQFYGLESLWFKSSEDDIIFLVRLNSGISRDTKVRIGNLYLGCKAKKEDLIRYIKNVELKDNPCNITSKYITLLTGELHSIKFGKEDCNQYAISFDNLKHNFY